MPEKPEVARINADLDKDFYRQVKRFAVDNDMSIKDLLIKALSNLMGEA